MLILKNLLFTLISPCTVAVYIPYLLTRNETAKGRLSFAISILIFATGAAIYFWCLWNFASYGKGTPAPIDAPKKLVTSGLYRYVRNPMYVGVITTILGWVILYHSWVLLIYAFFFWICFELFIVFYEEPHLRKIFGAEYEQYCARVGRWIPKITSNKIER
ncbi:isoprenylcysteine carboxylmethyltransferase family protein [bacterium]|nr:isoprenylcysteine carboxylmethyltransferase family protein [bacterium]MCI0612185.1 isoprenylcysteine carboxylmethyltransferase family protein [bacterium]